MFITALTFIFPCILLKFEGMIDSAFQKQGDRRPSMVNKKQGLTWLDLIKKYITNKFSFLIGQKI